MEAICLDTHPHILLAEDDFEFRELLNFALIRAGYLITSCDNGQELLERLLQPDAYDLVITDLRMPVLSGLEVLERLQQQPGLPPVICMTAFGDPQLHARAKGLGARAIIDKPFDLDEMIGLVRLNCHDNRKPTLSGVDHEHP